MDNEHSGIMMKDRTGEDLISAEIRDISWERILLHVPEGRLTTTGDPEPDDRHVAYLLDSEEKDHLYTEQWMTGK